MKKIKYIPVDQKVDFVSLETKWLNSWNNSGLYRKYLDKNKSAKKRFSFIDGPITANNLMGVHHCWGRTYKDIVQKYKNMQGFEQRFQNGFDCQGLWVEVGVEKELGFNSKKDIEKYGVAKFTQFCKDRVAFFANKQTQQSIRLGYFMDWENSYYTNSETNNLYIWQFLKNCHEKGLLYKGKSAIVWCPRCETGLSKHEQADGYKDIEDTSVYVKFKIVNRKNEYMLAWTTTPWTLSANVLLAVNPKYQYVKVANREETYYLAEESATRLGLTNQSKVDAKTLLGLEYESLYDILVQKGVKHYVTKWDLVDPQEGTGVVHIAPGCGEEDFNLGKELNSDIIAPLLENGHFDEGYGSLSGKYAHDVTQEVIDYLSDINALYKTEMLTHNYPHCWRCGTKCLFRLENNWFIGLQKEKQKLVALSKSIKWQPEYTAKRMENWLQTMGDWMISRKRYYGLSLPFYECKSCNHLTVIGSKEELKSLAVNPGMVDKLPSLHRPWIDGVEINCPNCKESVKRVSDVGDCWLDAGVVPFSTLNYFGDKTYWQKWFPADWICEMVEQIRLWYYSMLVYAYVFENKIPYLMVSNTSEIRDEKGERISKSRGNGIPFDEAAEKIGIDVMRWMYCALDPTLNLNFGYEPANETRRSFHLILWNVYNYFVTYANLDQWERSNNKTVSKSVLDQWIMSRLNSLIRRVTQLLDKFDIYNATREIESFVNDLSTWYLRRSRTRTGQNNNSPDNKDAFYETMWEVIASLSQVLAPFIPFLSEEIYTNLTKEESVHLSNWPTVGKIDTQLIEDMAKVRNICEKGHALRKAKEIKVRQPLRLLNVHGSKSLIEGLVQLIRDELNVKEVVFDKKSGKDITVELDTTITPELKAEGEARDVMRLIQEARKEAGCDIKEVVKVGLPSWPKEREEEIKKKTLASELFVSNDIHIVRS